VAPHLPHEVEAKRHFANNANTRMHMHACMHAPPPTHTHNNKNVDTNAYKYTDTLTVENCTNLLGSQKQTFSVHIFMCLHILHVFV